MKKSSIIHHYGSLFVALRPCSNTDEQVSGNLTPAPGKLSVSDLNEILANLELTESTLTYYGETTNTCKANFAIRTESYIEKLQVLHGRNIISRPNGTEVMDIAVYLQLPVFLSLPTSVAMIMNVSSV